MMVYAKTLNDFKLTKILYRHRSILTMIKCVEVCNLKKYCSDVLAKYFKLRAS